MGHKLFCFLLCSILLVECWATQFTGYMINVQVDMRNGDIYLATRSDADSTFLYKENGDLRDRKKTEVNGYVMSIVIDDVRDELVVCRDDGLCTHHDLQTLKSKGPALQGENCAHANNYFVLDTERYCPIGQPVTAFVAHNNLFLAGDVEIRKCQPDIVDRPGAVYKLGPSSKVLHDQFVYGFDFNGYSYFVGSFQRNGQMEVRISRVCQDDVDRLSYMEVPLRCNCSGVMEYTEDTSDEAISRSRRYINWAHMTKINAALAAALDASDEDNVLYFVVESRCLCVVTMADVDESFVESVASCMAGTTSTSETGTLQCIPNSYSTASQQLCTGPESAIGIEVVGTALRAVRSKVRVASVMNSGGHSILVYSDGESDRFVNIHQTDVILPSTSIVTVDEEPSMNCNGATEIEFRLHPDNANIFAVSRFGRSKSSVRKLPLWDCSSLTSCSSCLSSQNPLCGWCAEEQKCTLEPLCKSTLWIQAMAEGIDWTSEDVQQLCLFPEDVGTAGHTLKFDPTSILLTPRLSLCGVISPNPTGSFMTDQAAFISFSVFVDDVPCLDVTNPADQCQVDGVTSGGYAFVCTLLSQKRELDGPVYAQFLLAVGPSFVRMRVTSSENFNMRVPTIESFTPTKGPRSGETIVTIAGTDLLLNSNMHITIGDQSCQLTGTPTASSLQCTTTAVEELMSSIISITYNDGEYTAESDGTYTYTEDPTVTYITPKTIFLRGRYVYTVLGTGIDTVLEPTFTVAMLENNVQVNEWSSTCQVESATSMLCPIPLIDLPGGIDVDYDDGQCGFISSTTSGEEVQFRVGFTFDGVEKWRLPNIAEHLDNAITVARDPVFSVFAEENNILIIDPMDNVTIKGTRLDCVNQLEGIEIRLGDGFCDILFINHTVLVCEPLTTNETLKLHPVKVLIGDSEDATMVYDVGYIQYQEPTTTEKYIPTTIQTTLPTTEQPLITTTEMSDATSKNEFGPTSKTIDTTSSYMRFPTVFIQTSSRGTIGYAAQTGESFWSSHMIIILAVCGAVTLIVVALIAIACIVRRKRVNGNDKHHNNNPKEAGPKSDKYGVTYVPNEENGDSGKVYFLPQRQERGFAV